MQYELYAAVYKNEYNTNAYLFTHKATGVEPYPPSGVELAERLTKLGHKINFVPEVEELTPVLVNNPDFLKNISPEEMFA